MKKVIVALVVLFSLNLAFVSCRDTNKEPATEETSELQKEAENAVEEVKEEVKEIEQAAEKAVNEAEEKVEEAEESLEKAEKQDDQKEETSVDTEVKS